MEVEVRVTSCDLYGVCVSVCECGGLLPGCFIQNTHT